MTKQYTCKVCGQLGHNARRHRSTSPKTKVVVTKEKEVPTFQRTTSPKKRCSYCREKGHTSASCILKLRDTTAFKEKYSLFHERITTNLNSRGLNTGSIVCLEEKVTSSWSVERTIEEQIEHSSPKLTPEEQTVFDALLSTAIEEMKDSFTPVKYSVSFLVIDDVSKSLRYSSPESYNDNGSIHLYFQRVYPLGLTAIPDENTKTPAIEKLVHLLLTMEYRNLCESRYYYSRLIDNSISSCLTGDFNEFIITNNTKIINSDSYKSTTVNYDTSKVWESRAVRELLSPDNVYDRRCAQNRLRHKLISLNTTLGLSQEYWLNAERTW